MSEQEQDLRAELKTLHDHIEAAMHKEPADRDLLSHIMTDLVRVAEGEELHEEESETLKAQLEEKAADFESRHPRTAGVLREVMEVLSRLGF